MAPTTACTRPGAGFSPEDRLLVLLTLAAPDGAEEEEARRLATAAIPWPRLLKRVRHNDVAPLVWRNLRRLGLWDSVPARVRQVVEERRMAIERLNLLRLERAADLFGRLRGRQVEVIVLKGVAFAATVYQDPAYKKMNDMDLLVRVGDIAAVRQVLAEMDMVPLALLDGGDEDPDPAKTHHLPAYVSRDLQFVVGIHWGLVSPKSGFRLDYEGIWSRRTPVRIQDQPVSMLGPLDALHHLCVHFHYYKTGLKELGDFANLLRHQPRFDWDGFGNLVSQAGTQTAAYRPLRLTEAIYGVGVPPGLFAAWKAVADPFVASDTDRLAGRPDLLLMSRSTYSSQIEKAYLAFTYENRLPQKLAWLGTFWSRLLFPPREVVWRTNACLPGEQSLRWLYLMNLYRTAREVGRDYGLAIFFLLMLKSLADLVTDLGAAGGKGRMEQLRERLGQDEARIHQFMETFD